MNKKIVVIAIILVFVIILSIILSNPEFHLTPYQIYYSDGVRNFRADLNEARKVPVYPSEDTLRNILFNPEVYKIDIAYFPNDTENSYYLASGFEITIKLGIIYKNFLGNETQTFEEDDGSTCLIFPNRNVRCFRPVAINSTDELNPSPTEPVILMLGPSHANQTAVSIYNFTITLEGKSFQEVNRTYTDLDLAADKMLLSLMEI